MTNSGVMTKREKARRIKKLSKKIRELEKEMLELMRSMTFDKTDEEEEDQWSEL